MNKTRDSLGGKNKGGRTTGARSSRASSTIFKKLKELDRKITKIDETIRFRAWLSSDIKKLKKQREELDKKRKELTKSIEYHCSNLDESDIVLYNSDIWCDNWRSTGVTPPVGYANIGYEIKDLTKKIEDLEDDFENSQNRWALTVTTYKDCFEPSKVIDATEILSK